MNNLADYSKLKQLLDFLMTSVMYILQGNFYETPQQTHVWNRRDVLEIQQKRLKPEWFVTERDPMATEKPWIGIIPLFHMPIFGGWKTFMVLAPSHTLQRSWHVGWIVDGKAQVSQIPIDTTVRILLCMKEVSFFWSRL